MTEKEIKQKSEGITESKEETVKSKELVEVKEIPETEEKIVERKPPAIPEGWKPKTSLGKAVMNGEIKNIEEILIAAKQIRESEIVDTLLPNLKNELILVGGRKGKGGGIQRIPVRTTATMTKSGRRFTMNAFAVIGNEDGIVGISKASSPEGRNAVNKALRKAKLNLILVNRGCGSWECGCNTNHSIPFKATGKCGSVKVELLPAPKGVGLVCSDEIKKIFRLAGIKDVWTKSYGHTRSRINFITAIFNAFKNLNIYKK